jgi:hypothetical protein
MTELFHNKCQHVGKVFHFLILTHTKHNYKTFTIQTSDNIEWK